MATVQESEGYCPMNEGLRFVLTSKIHNATVTDANPDYVGSITIDQKLLDRANLWPGERVLVVSNTTGVRLETYVIPGGDGVICLNGAAALLIKTGEEVIIMGFSLASSPVKANAILVDKSNEFVGLL